MKTKKKIFSFFNLLLFVGYFGFSSLSALTPTRVNSHFNSSTKQFTAKESLDVTGSNQCLFEPNENESENENSKHHPTYIPPFFLSQLQIEVSNPQFIPMPSIGVSQHESIYLSVCNFRI